MNKSKYLQLLARSIGLLGLIFSLLFSMPKGSAAPENTQPEIIGIQIQESDVVVTVQVPEGITKVTLEGRSRLGIGNWTPRAIERVDGSGGLLVIRVAYTKANEILRVRGDDKEELPAAFYKGKTDFNGQKDDASGVGAGGLPTPEIGNEFDSVTESADTNKNDGQQRDVVESDIWSIHNDTLYFFNSLRGLQVID
ncbi:MAG: hypothetical protein QF731_11025, partial [Verrucomicrobiota bacterium]|nr:hypothetical protein [Verrucomicrobiota bacterium]